MTYTVPGQVKTAPVAPAPRYNYPIPPAPPLTVAQLDGLLAWVMADNIAVVWVKVVIMGLKLAFIVAWLTAREKLISMELARAKQIFEQSVPQDGQHEADLPTNP